MFGLRGMAIAGAISLLVGFSVGWSWRDSRCDAAALRLQVESLQAETTILYQRLRTADMIADADAQRAQADQDIIEELRKRADETPANANACLPADAARRVRDIR
jgi:hypothetical protein